MGLDFPWPITTGEWLAWTSAAATALIGLLYLFAPRLMLRLSGLAVPLERQQALAHLRGPVAGFLLGVGLGAILLGQPLVYLVLGFAWGFTAFGRVIGMLSDGAGLRNSLHLIAETGLAVLALLFATGIVP